MRGEHSRWPIAALSAPMVSYLVLTEFVCACWAGFELAACPPIVALGLYSRCSLGLPSLSRLEPPARRAFDDGSARI